MKLKKVKQHWDNSNQDKSPPPPTKKKKEEKIENPKCIGIFILTLHFSWTRKLKKKNKNKNTHKIICRRERKKIPT